ncbi:MmgE/PrpD family protein [Nocardioides sp. Kera G14]|uniref:MmgE/PrpD family protein n=1 Tax=Nocardioides sp. Kera G14 TaxID=2884264 RepID=UPI001D130687|nr:MmgE/PrpD family protein [Nocardioides sp. Kera G14]UDY24595.1 MmgE/PrpD family protein [Nocardioides sp. Kera G14]
MTATATRATVPATTAAIAGFATRRRTATEASLNTDAVAITVLDTLGVAIAGSTTEAARVIAAWAADIPSVGAAPVWGTGTRAAPADAALVNGTASHALDWDDASPSVPMHPGAVLVPALLAQAVTTEVTGAQLVEAYHVGAAVFRAVSEALPVNASVARGWHNTATSGRLATAAALANLTRLDTVATEHALGLVASMSSGSVTNFGTMTKPLHAGLAARDGVVAVSLAARGFTADRTQLEDVHGFFAQYGERRPDLLAALPDRLEHWYDAWPTDWSIKRYPCCYGTHHAADAALDLRDRLDVADIERIDVSMYAADFGILTVGRPTTGLEAKFSLEYVVAVALLRGAVTLADFEDAAIPDPAVEALRARIHVVPDEDEPARFASLRVTLRNGRVLHTRTDLTRGDARNPMTHDEVRAKFVGACRSAGWPEESATDAADQLLALASHASVSQMVARLGDPTPRSERTTP